MSRDEEQYYEIKSVILVFIF